VHQKRRYFGSIVYINVYIISTVIPERLVAKASPRSASAKTKYLIYCIYNIYGYT
jgi:hypothetical protein